MLKLGKVESTSWGRFKKPQLATSTLTPTSEIGSWGHEVEALSYRSWRSNWGRVGGVWNTLFIGTRTPHGVFGWYCHLLIYISGNGCAKSFFSSWGGKKALSKRSPETTILRLPCPRARQILVPLPQVQTSCCSAVADLKELAVLFEEFQLRRLGLHDYLSTAYMLDNLPFKLTKFVNGCFSQVSSQYFSNFRRWLELHSGELMAAGPSLAQSISALPHIDTLASPRFLDIDEVTIYFWKFDG